MEKYSFQFNIYTTNTAYIPCPHLHLWACVIDKIDKIIYLQIGRNSYLLTLCEYIYIIFNKHNNRNIEYR